MKSNQLSLEEDRKRVTEAIEKRIRAEARKPVDNNFDLSTLLNHPIAVPLLGKLFGVDQSVLSGMNSNELMNALKDFLPSNGA
ncbi:MAG: hypothetical protein L6Q54_15915, partial [Leptospiraceae bacterium]|nr:hypothetical protein [Leptospiraceae bacterium]